MKLKYKYIAYNIVTLVMTINILVDGIGGSAKTMVKTACEKALYFTVNVHDLKSNTIIPTRFVREENDIRFVEIDKGNNDAVLMVISVLFFVKTKRWFFDLLTYQELASDVNSRADRIAEEIFKHDGKIVKIVMTHTNICNKNLTIQIVDMIRARYDITNEWILLFERDDRLALFVKDLARRAKCKKNQPTL